MSFEIIDNTFQVIVLAAMAFLAFLLAFRRSSRSCLILAFGYASFMMGTLYYLLHLIILGHGPQVFYVAECSWMASYFFFLSLEILYWEGLRPPFSPFALAAGVVIAGVVIEIFQICHVDTWKGIYISRLDSLRTGHGNLSGHVVLSCVEKLSDGCKKKK